MSYVVAAPERPCSREPCPGPRTHLVHLVHERAGVVGFPQMAAVWLLSAEVHVGCTADDRLT